jgi:hypothetical protein
MASFFDPPPDPPEPPKRPALPPPRPWHGVPGGVIGRTVALNLVLGRSAKAAIWIASVTAYPDVFEFEVEIRHRDRAAFSHDFPWPDGLHRGVEELDPELFRLGLQFSDGRKATNVNPGPGFWPRDRDTPPAGLILSEGGGGGGGDAAGGSRWRQEYWVWPLPPEGPLAFVCEWPIADIPETRSEIDSAPFRDAANEAVILWSGSETGGGFDGWSRETYRIDLPESPPDAPSPGDPPA